MKKEDVPQDESPLGKITKEVCYVTDQSGQYITQLSSGWDVKKNALDVTWQNIEERAAEARKKVESKQASPLLFFMEFGLMDIAILAKYTGFWKWQIKRHLRPTIFERLSDKKLKRYAEVFNISIEDLKKMKVHEH